MRVLNKNGVDDTTPTVVVEQTGRVLMSRLPNVGGTTITLVSDKAYFVYMGRTTQNVMAKYVEFYVNTAGTGAQTAEVGLFRSANPPNKSTQGTNGITKLTATGTIDSLTSTGLKRNTNPLNYVVPAGTYLWAGIRTAMATTQPALAGLCMDFGEGMILSTATAGALTNAGPWTGAFIAQGTYFYTTICPELRINLD